jgi:mono/diheme cytochrome c family protein
MGCIRDLGTDLIKRASGIAFAGGLVWFAATATPGAAQEPNDAKLQSEFTSVVKPLLTKYCATCHGGSAPSGAFDLAAVGSLAQVRTETARWRRLREYVATSHMPPPGVPQPSGAERKRITEWVDSLLGGRKAGDPGRVTIRRLNRSEYNNTVRDLLYLNATPAEEFPSDDVGYGFDNIGDVLSVSPLLMEKYIQAAERLASAAIVIPLNRTVKFEAAEFGEVAGSSLVDGGDRNFFTNGFMGGPHEFPADGDYVIRAKAFGQQAGPEVCKMAFRVDGRPVQVVEVAAVKSAPGTYQVPVKL